MMKVQRLLVVLLSVLSLAGTDAANARQDSETLLPVPENLSGETPPARTPAEVSEVLQTPDPAASEKPVRIVLLAGTKDHGPGEHDYPAWQNAWLRLLQSAPNVKASTAWEEPSEEDLKSADAIVWFRHGAWPEGFNTAVDEYFDRGAGMVFIHYAVDPMENHDSVQKRLGLCWDRENGKFRHGWMDLVFDPRADHPIARGFKGKSIRLHDETYWRLKGDPNGIRVLATAEEEGAPQPMFWTRETGNGRVFVCILGHYNWSFNDPLFRVLLLRGIAWAAGAEPCRFDSLALQDLE